MEQGAKVDKARAYFTQGYNCAQAVFAAFAEEMGLQEESALRLSSSFGGGMGGLREVCGAVSGMFMVLGMLEGYDKPDAPGLKKQHYAMIRGMASKMTEQHGSILCRDLLKSHKIKQTPIPRERDADYYQARPCLCYVETCAALLEERLKGTA